MGALPWTRTSTRSTSTVQTSRSSGISSWPRVRSVLHDARVLHWRGCEDRGWLQSLLVAHAYPEAAEVPARTSQQRRALGMPSGGDEQLWVVPCAARHTQSRTPHTRARSAPVQCCGSAHDEAPAETCRTQTHTAKPLQHGGMCVTSSPRTRWAAVSDVLGGTLHTEPRDEQSCTHVSSAPEGINL